MPAAELTGDNRRGKTALFVILCGSLGALPHWFDTTISLAPALILALLLGGYGLKTVFLSEQNYRNDDANSFQDIDQSSLPYIDVLVAARDEESVIKGLVERLSALRYPKKKLSILIIDDGSKDSTPLLLKEISEKHQNLEVIYRAKNSGGGKSGALNEALSRSNGEWLLILDADAQLHEDSLYRLISSARKGKWSAIQLRKAVINSKDNFLTRFQAMEMAMDAIIQEGRLKRGGVVELRGNGQFIRRNVIDQCGGFNENTVTDDLDLSFRLLLSGSSVGILWDPPVQEEAVESLLALWKQRQRWAEGGLQRFFDYWPLLISDRLTFIQRRDLACFFLLQYALPIISIADLITTFITRTIPAYWPLSIIAFSVSGFAFWRGCNRTSEGPQLPAPNLFKVFFAIGYLAHWFIVIPWVTFRMAIFPKTLVWVKTSHRGSQSIKV